MSGYYLDVIAGKQVKKPPVWLMRQAGRYLPEYREIRKQQGSFVEMCKNPKVAAEVTLQPLKRFRLDAAILFSDILALPEAMGLGVNFIAGEGPVIKNPIRSKSDIDKIDENWLDKISYLTETIGLIKADLNKLNLPLIGFAGSIWTVLCYVVAGGSQKDFPSLRRILYQDRDFFAYIFELFTDFTLEYLLVQCRAGVDSLMLFDSWASLMPYHEFEAHAVPSYRKIIDGIRLKYPNMPITIFAKHIGLLNKSLFGLDFNILGLDWSWSLQDAIDIIPEKFIIQGNIDPLLLHGSKDLILDRVHQIKQEIGSRRIILNLGHGLLPNTPISGVNYLLESIESVFTD